MVCPEAWGSRNRRPWENSRPATLRGGHCGPGCWPGRRTDSLVWARSRSNSRRQAPPQTPDVGLRSALRGCSPRQLDRPKRRPLARPWKPGYPVAPRAPAAMRRHGGPTKRARRRGTMCPSPHQGGTDRGCTLQPSPDLAPVQKRLRTFSAQFHDLRLVRAQIPAAWRRTLRIMVRIVRQGKEIARYWGETQMRKISLVAAIALMLAGVGVWATSTTQARIDVPAGAQINPLQIMMGARRLPVAHYDDYSLVFN